MNLMRPAKKTVLSLRVAIILVLFSWVRGASADIPQPPLLLLTAQENGVDPQTEFGCSGPIHGYITLPAKTVGKHSLEGIWTGPKGTVVQHSQSEVNFPSPGRRT